MPEQDGTAKGLADPSAGPFGSKFPQLAGKDVEVTFKTDSMCRKFKHDDMYGKNVGNYRLNAYIIWTRFKVPKTMPLKPENVE